MTLFRRTLSALLLFGIAAAASAQQEAVTHVQWSAELEPKDVRAGEAAQVILTAKIDPGWHIYSLTQPEGGPVPTTVTFPAGPLKYAGRPNQPAPIKSFEKTFNMEVESFERGFAVGLPVTVAPSAKGAIRLQLEVESQSCDAKQCLLPHTAAVPLSFSIAPGPARADRTAAVTKIPPQPAWAAAPKPLEQATEASQPPAAATGSDASTQIEEAKRRGLLAYMALAFVAGLVSLLTPCVFPMIPITVSFFAKRRVENGQSRFAAPLAYCGGIIGTYVGLGLIVTLIAGPAGLNRFAANPWVNLGLALLFIVLAGSLFGAFELVLPSGLINKAHQGTTKQGLVGPVMMGLTFTLTSFTCTVPFVGSLLATGASGGLLYPALGMFAYATAFAAPFFFLALFPQYLARLPKSGSWLTVVKATMGFLELAMAVKFLSNVDVAWQWMALTRPVFLGVWSVIFIAGALYLVGWMRLPHDESGIRIGAPRRIVGIGFAAFGLYCLAAMEGAPLGQLEAFPPPVGYTRNQIATQVNWIKKWDAAFAEAKKRNAPLLINFTGWSCVNCREMEQNVLPNPQVVRELQAYVPAEIYTDRDTPEERENQKRQLEITKSVALPIYAVVSPSGRLVAQWQGRASVDQMVKFLRDNRNARSTSVGQP